MLSHQRFFSINDNFTYFVPFKYFQRSWLAEVIKSAQPITNQGRSSSPIGSLPIRLLIVIPSFGHCQAKPYFDNLIWHLHIDRPGLVKLSQSSVIAGYLGVHTYYFYLFAISEVFPHSLTSEQRALSLKMPHSDSLPPPHYNLTLIMDSRPQTSWSILSQGGGTLACPSIMAF